MTPPRRAPDHGGLPGAYTTLGSSSFVDFLAAVSGPAATSGVTADAAVRAPQGTVPGTGTAVVEATTIIALETAHGVLMAGDRRATAGNVIANRDVVKVHPADDTSVIGVAGVAGIGLELIRLFQVELEHFEKIEGATLSLEGKASRLASMLRANLGLTLQGLAAVPLFAGFDGAAGRGRIWSYDVTGGRYPEAEFHGIGSGSWFARGALKKLWRPGLPEADAVAVAVEALFDAADDDSATGGPDPVRGIWPVVAVVDADGYRETPDEVVSATVAAIAERRTAERAVGTREGGRR